MLEALLAWPRFKSWPRRPLIINEMMQALSQYDGVIAEIILALS